MSEFLEYMFLEDTHTMHYLYLTHSTHQQPLKRLSEAELDSAFRFQQNIANKHMLHCRDSEVS